MREKITRPSQVRNWTGSIPVQYVYTAGITGEAFLRGLKERGLLLTSTCPQCQTRYLPARLYCERCLTRTADYAELPPRGVVHAVTAAHYDLEGEALDPPQLYAFISFPLGGGLVHRLGEVEPARAHLGMTVEAVLLPPEERTGSIEDIVYFRPADEEPPT